jgi:hypothetical protein
MQGIAETVSHDWKKAAWFYGRFGITKATFRQGVPASPEPAPLG